jgi:hypothetical protein
METECLILMIERVNPARRTNFELTDKDAAAEGSNV